MPTKFEELVRHYADKNKSAAESPVDWEERKTWWQQRVSQLFDQIYGWLKPLIDSDTITFSKQHVPLTEEALGTYEVESCTIGLQKQKLTFKPLGSVIIGGFGRIDVDGPNGNVMLILSTPDKDIPREQLRDKSNMVHFPSKETHKPTPLYRRSF